MGPKPVKKQKPSAAEIAEQQKLEVQQRVEELEALKRTVIERMNERVLKIQNRAGRTIDRIDRQILEARDPNAAKIAKLQAKLAELKAASDALQNQ